MSTTILSVMLLIYTCIYCQIIDIYIYIDFIILGMLEEWAVKYIMLHCDFFFCIIYDNLNILKCKICP